MGEKILAINFKYLGDVVVMTPALRAITKHFPDCELHVLVGEEAVPLLKHNPFIEKVWGFPRRGKKAGWTQIKDLLYDLRTRRFDRSVDFVGNDRGAILSRIIGAKRRLGLIPPGGFFGRKWCYNERMEEFETSRHEVIRMWSLLTAWDIPFFEGTPKLEVYADPELSDEAAELLPERGIVCNVSARQQKREWSIDHWIEFYSKALSFGIPIYFVGGPSDREREFLSEIKLRIPSVRILPKFENLDEYIATISRAYCMISLDTAPLHIAAGLGIPTIGLFGPMAASRWAPLGKLHQFLQGGLCPCSGHLHVCQHSKRCIDEIKPEQVLKALENLIKVHPVKIP